MANNLTYTFRVAEQLFTIPLSWLRPHLNSYGQELLGLEG